MFDLFRLIRFRTLAYAAFIMYVVRYFVIHPILDINRENGFTLQMTDEAFSLLVVAILCLISGAYIINDYFDTKVDRISGVKEIVIGKSVGRRTAIILHTVLNVVAIGITFYFGFAVGVWKIGVLFLLVSGLLWFYSSTYKRYLIVGNLLVALLAALIPFSVIIYEIPLLNMAYANILIPTHTNFIYMFSWIGGLSWFIFLNTLMYEINKDIYTFQGDDESGNRTISVCWGTLWARRIIGILAGIAILSLVVLYFTVFSDSLAILVYFLVALIIPYSIYLIVVLGKNDNRRFQLRLIRAIMVLCVGACFLLKPFFDWVLQNNHLAE